MAVGVLRGAVGRAAQVVSDRVRGLHKRIVAGYVGYTTVGCGLVESKFLFILRDM